MPIATPRVDALACHGLPHHLSNAKRFLPSVAVLILTVGRTAMADQITYTETFTGSGSLDGTSFTDASITLTGVGDTSGIFSPFPPVLHNPRSLATVDVSGTEADTFADPIAAFANNGAGAVGFIDIPSSAARKTG